MHAVLKSAQAVTYYCPQIFKNRRWNCSSVEHLPKITPDISRSKFSLLNGIRLIPSTDFMDYIFKNREAIYSNEQPSPYRHLRKSREGETAISTSNSAWGVSLCFFMTNLIDMLCAVHLAPNNAIDYGQKSQLT